MKSTVILLLLLQGFTRLSAMTITNEQSTLSQLALVLQRLGAVKNPHIDLKVEVPRFCWTFEKAHPDSFKLLRQSLERFHGSFHWTLVSRGGEECLLGTVERPTYYSRRHDLGQRSRSSGPSTETSTVLQDLQEFATFLQSWLDGKQLLKATRENYIDPGVHDIWIIFENPETFAHKIPAGLVDARDYKLSFGVTLLEFEALYSDILGLHAEDSDLTTQDKQTFPLLRRLGDPWGDASYLPTEIASLKSEAQMAAAVTENPQGRSGLSKIEQMCDIALKSQAGLYFLAN